MTSTTNFSLPQIAAAQSQKHVTHNDAITVLDSAINLTVINATTTTPPGSPSESDTYIVAATATGDWVGQEGKIAFYLDSAWIFFTPLEGWRCYNQATDELLVYSGSAWGGLGDSLTFTKLGVNATADTTNRLSATTPAALFNAETDDIQVKLNKVAATDTASFLFQDAWSGRAEIGLTGNDNFHFKVSADGSTWYNGITIDKDNGEVDFPNGLTLSGGSDVLSEYDEGTWTPQLEFGGGSTGMAGTFTGYYTRMGRLVVLTASVVLTAKGSSTGNAAITGLPFTPSPLYYPGQIIGISGMSGLSYPLSCRSGPGPELLIQQQLTTGLGTVSDSSFSNSSNFKITLTHTV